MVVVVVVLVGALRVRVAKVRAVREGRVRCILGGFCWLLVVGCCLWRKGGWVGLGLWEGWLVS